MSYCLICLEFLFYKMKRVKEIKGIDETLSIYLIPLNGILKMVKTVGFNRMHFVTIKKKKAPEIDYLTVLEIKSPKRAVRAIFLLEVLEENPFTYLLQLLKAV